MTRTFNRIPAQAVVRRAREWQPTEAVLALGLLASLIYAHAGALRGMVDLWNVSPMYSYGYTVPLISGYLLWARRDALRALTPTSDRLLGVPVTLLGIALLVSGRAGGIQVLEQVAFLVSLTGAVVLVFGRAFLRWTWAPLAYLLLMVPLWDAFTEPLHVPFQNRSAAIGCSVLQGVGIPAHCEGTFIALPGLNIEVARACSGVNYLVAVIALGLPLAYLYLQGTWRRVALIVSAVFVAALSNGLRVALIGLLAYLNIGSPLHGPFHVLHGLFVAGVGYLVLFGGVRLLAPDRLSNGRASVPDQRLRRWRLPRPESVGLLAVFLALGTGVVARQPTPVPLVLGLEKLPVRLDRWQAESAPPQRGADLWAGADARLGRRYRTADGMTIDLDIAYFAAQTQDREVAGFRTAGLHRRSRRVQVELPSRRTFTANLVLDRNGGPEALFWYELAGTTKSDPYTAKLWTLVRAVVRGRSEGAAVLLTVVGTGQSPVASVERKVKDLAGLVHDALAANLAGSVADPQDGR